MFSNMDHAIQAANASQNSSFWFAPATMEVWGTEVVSGLVAGHWFVTSEYSPHTFERTPEAPRVYTVRYIDDDGEVGAAPGTTMGEFVSYVDAMEAMSQCASGLRG